MEISRRQIVAEALLKRSIKNMIRVDEKIYADNSFITNAEYQLFLDQMIASGKYCQPDYWTDYEYDYGTGLDPAVGIRQSEAILFCVWLTQKEGGLWHYR